MKGLLPRQRFRPHQPLRGRWLALGLICAGLGAEPAIAQRPSQGSVPSFSLDAQETTILVGQTARTPYIVVIPGRNWQVLSRVQQYVPYSFLTRSRLGWYIQAGAFSRRSSAESLKHLLRSQGFDARVAYRRLGLRS